MITKVRTLVVVIRMNARKRTKTDNAPLYGTGEQIPVYEEFSACILFLTAIVAFFDLDMNSISAGDGKDNDARRFVEGWRAEPAPESAETRDKLVTSWLKALYESESITDSLLEGCSPYDLNDIMPVIMDQTFLATRAGLLPANSQKNGLERKLHLYCS